MYVSTNPNQVIAQSQGYQSGASAWPVGFRPSMHGNTVTYAFNPTLSSGNQSFGHGGLNIGWNPLLASQAYNPAFSSGMFNQGQAAFNPYFHTQAWSNQLASQAFNPAMSSGQLNFNAIASSTGIAQMRVDLAETNSDVVVAAELPNVSLNDMIITVTDDSLSISATAWSGSYATNLYRTIALPTTIKSEQVEATYANGILEVRAPKSDVVTRRKIKVNAAQ